MKLKLGKKNIILIGLVVLLVGFGFLLFGENGILKYYKLKKEYNVLKCQIDTTETENMQLRQSIDSLKNFVPAKVEKISREKHGMRRKNEKILEVIEK